MFNGFLIIEIKHYVNLEDPYVAVGSIQPFIAYLAPRVRKQGL